MKTLFKNSARIFQSHQRRHNKFQTWLLIIFVALGMSSTSLLAQQAGGVTSNTTIQQDQNTTVSKQGVLQIVGADAWSVTKEYFWTVLTGVKTMGFCMALEGVVKTVGGGDAAVEVAEAVVAAAVIAVTAPEDIAVIAGMIVEEAESLAETRLTSLAEGEVKNFTEKEAAPFCTRLYNNLAAKFAKSRVYANMKFLLGNSVLTAGANLVGTSSTAVANSNDASPLEMKAFEYSSEFVAVGDPNNQADPLTGLGAVAESFQIGMYDVTVAQWALFLTAVKATENDARHLYHPQESLGETSSYHFLQPFEDQGSASYLCDDKNMFSYTDSDGISTNYQSTRFPSPAAFPITGISLNDAKRYCNWRHHGSPFIHELNEETMAITETGAYDFTNGQEGVSCEGASYFLPTLNQWYKATYYKRGGITAGYWKYPLQADQLPFQGSIDALLKVGAIRKGINGATITHGWFYNTTTYYTQEAPHLTPVGFFKDSLGPYGAYDLGGNVRKWTSDLVQTKQGIQAVAPGGSWNEPSDALLSTHANTSFDLAGGSTIGLRICAESNEVEQNLAEDNQQTAYQNKANMLQTQQEQEYARAETFCGLVILGAVSEAAAFFGLEVPDAMSGEEKQTWEQVLARWDLSRWAINAIYVVGTSTQNAMRDVPIH